MKQARRVKNKPTVKAPNKFHRFETLTDEEVAIIAQEENCALAVEYLVQKYKNLVRAKARTYFLIGADREDIIQEGMIGLYKATRDFQSDRQVSFRAFADICITRQIITAVKTATRQKHIPLNSYISLNKPVTDNDKAERTLMEMLEGSGGLNPEEFLISNEEFKRIEAGMADVLSDLEQKVLAAYLDGKSYIEMGAEFDRSVKSIDNALQRAKRKLGTYLAYRLWEDES